ncbi:hypothetical protein [Nucisporomicrobium flavum]|uniref:hypothetical protein n=1 Tax=Nucisporomicrobium flavum TaxID=2785915 RepID=UPI0018F37977|nr:hypothetical protein [Nucisporomicrobium flavum]
MDAHRRYAEEPEPSWYTGQRTSDGQGSYAAPAPGSSPYESGVHERPSGAFRLPEQRPADPYASPASYAPADPVTTSGSYATSSVDSGSMRIPVRGPEYPTIRPTSNPLSAADPASASPAVSTVTTTTTYGAGALPNAAASPSVPGSSAYDEPTSMVPLAAGSRPESVYNSRRPVTAVIFAAVTGVLLVPALLLLVHVTFVSDPVARGVVPAVLLTLGLPLTGAGLYFLAGAGRVAGREAWLRPPLAYLPIGLVLLLAAGLAVA